MFVIHTALMTAAAVLVAATSAGGRALRRRGRDLPIMGYIIGGGLLVGNSASLIDTAPLWYRVAMITVSMAGFAWFAFAVATAEGPEAADRDAAQIAHDIFSGRMPARPAAPRHLHVVRAVDTDTIEQLPSAPKSYATIDAEIVEEPVRASADQDTFDAYAPAGRSVTGQTYVAAHIGDYVDTRGARRAHGRHVARRHDLTDPTVRFLRLAEAYAVDRPRSLGRSAHA